METLQVILIPMSNTGNTEKQKSATVAIIGRPSAGKSTFLNTVCGGKVSIVSPVPQTTRNTVRGIVNASMGQLVFIDTPGYHESEKKMNKKLQDLAVNQLAEADLILYLLDSSRIPGSEEELIVSILLPYTEKLVCGINKTDIKGSFSGVCRVFLTENLKNLPDSRIFDISAKNDTNIDPLLIELFKMAPEGEALYPPEYFTDQEVSFRISEIIREKAINLTRDEIPHCLFVEIQDMEMKKNGKELWVRGFLCVERESQKGIVIGKGASVIKKIKEESLKELNSIFPYRVNLDLQVRVNKNWRQNDTILNKLI